MEEQKNLFPLGLTFDDLLLLPGYTDFSREEINLSTYITKKLKISLPFVSSPMDTVTQSKLAISLGELGGVGIIHRNFSISDQVKEVRKVKVKKLLVGAAVGAEKGFEERVRALLKANCDIIVVDSAHGFTKKIIQAVSYIKENFKIQVIAGNISTKDGASALIKAGADGLRVGMGPGAICTTRIISGMGVPQLTAIFETAKIAKKAKVPIIADGGIKYSGDVTKALAAGASLVMMGSFFASSKESPGKKVILRKENVPSRFLSIFNHKNITFPFKEYRGMGSTGAMKEGAKTKTEGEFHGKDYYKDKIMVAEGVEGLVPIKGSVKELTEQLIGGLKSGMFYVGAKNIKELWEKANFIQISQSSLTESHPHSILVTNSGKNYS